MNIKMIVAAAAVVLVGSLFADEACKGPDCPDMVTLDLNALKSCDPNEIDGPLGVGEQRYVKPGDWMDYTIYFENISNATASAQEITVTLPKGVWLDWSTLELGEVVFGANVDNGLADGRSRSSSLVLPGQGMSVKTKVTETDGDVVWYMRCWDEKTPDNFPEDAAAGFLPPNDETHRGEGHITYRVKVRDDAPAGIRIDAAATIVFDQNDPIPTDPSWWNTVHAPLAAPSDVTAVATGVGVGISWSPVEDGAFYRVMRDNGDGAGPVAVSDWISECRFTDATAVRGESYRYFVQSSLDASGGLAGDCGDGIAIETWLYSQAPIDFNGDGRCDIAVYDPKAANWYSEVFGVAQYGWGSTIPTPADYDGDGITDYAAYDQADGAWYILFSADNRYFIPHWGWTGALPVPADYDGDGCADICVFDTKTSTWYIHGTSAGDRVQQFGWAGVVPVPADYDGDGKIDLAIYSPHKKTGNAGAWYILRSSDGATEIYTWGWDGAIPTPADFDGDGKADLAVFNRLDGFWYIHRSSIGGNDCWVPQYGWKTATPVPADYDGDGIADLGIYDLTTGVWYTFGTSEGHRERTFGWRGAVPLNPIYWIHRWFGL